MKIAYKKHMDPKHVEALITGLDQYAKETQGMPPSEDFSFTLMDGDNCVGGVKGYMYYGCCSIDILWIHPDLRGKGFGKQLMQKVEDLAKERQCLMLLVRTMQWEARGFYEKCGFKLEDTQHGFLKDKKMYYLRKKLSS